MMKYSIIKKDQQNGLPTYDSLEPIVLKLASKKQNWQSREIRLATVDYLLKVAPHHFLEEHEDKMFERAGFALSWLHSQYGLLEKPFKKTYRITEQGKNILSEHHDYGSIFNAIKALPKISKDKTEDVPKHLKSNFYDRISDQFDDYNDRVKSELLDKINDREPAFFEQLVVTLLSKMGYKGKHGDAIVTQLSNDNGIDGVINQDPLGTSTVYLQAKRYDKSHHVTAPQIQGFRGALESKRATKGVFITTSDFSNGALEEAKRLSIVTVNGDELTDLMLEYQVGVQVKEDFKFLTIDNDFF